MRFKKVSFVLRLTESTETVHDLRCNEPGIGSFVLRLTESTETKVSRAYRLKTGKSSFVLRLTESTETGTTDYYGARRALFIRPSAHREH